MDDAVDDDVNDDGSVLLLLLLEPELFDDDCEVDPKELLDVPIPD